MIHPSPPRLAEALLWLLLPAGRRDEFIGDLREEYAEQHRSGPRVARHWYWREVLRSRPFALRKQVNKPPETGSPQPTKGKASVMDTLVSDLRLALRALWKNPAFATVAILTLAIGIGANTAVFSLVNGVLLRDVHALRPDRVLAIYMSDSSSGPFGGASYPDYASIAESSKTLIALAAYRDSTPMSLSSGDETIRINGTIVSGNYFKLLGIEAQVGTLFDITDNLALGGDPVVILSDELWRTTFGGDAEVIGREITLTGRSYTILGVAPRGFRGTQMRSRPALWLPMSMLEAANPNFAGRNILERRGARFLFMIGRMRDDVTLEQTQAELATIATQLGDEFPQSNMGTLQQPDRARPISAMLARHAFVGAAARQQAELVARLLLVVVGFVLLIVCANVANLLLSRAGGRRQELAVRQAIGASRGRLLRQLLTESLLIAALGGIGGLLLAIWLRSAAVTFDFGGAFGAGVSAHELALDRNVLLFSALVTLSTGILFGVVPALRASRPDLVPALKDGSAGDTNPARGFGLRGLLVVAQVAMSVVLLVGAGLFVRSLQNALDTELGFAPDNVLLADMDLSLRNYDEARGVVFFDELMTAVGGLPGVEAVSLANLVPVTPRGARTTVQIEGYQPIEGEDMELNFNVVAPGYFEALGIDLLRGRTLEAADASGERVVVINETFARHFWPGQDPLGRAVQFGGQETPDRVVGVVRDGKYRSIREDPYPYMYLPLAGNFSSTMTLVVRTESDPTSLLAAVRSEARRLDADLPVSGVRTLDDQVSGVLSAERAAAIMLGGLGIVALLLAAVGIYGVTSQSVQARTHEIGIRMAIGADASSVLGMVVGQGLFLVLVGVVVGLIGATVLTRAVASMLFGVSAGDPLTFVGVVLLLIAAALISCLLPARRATRINPIAALRSE